MRWRELQPVLHEEFAASRRGGLPRDQPLADRATRAARDRPAAVDPAHAGQRPAARRVRRRWSKRASTSGVDARRLAARRTSETRLMTRVEPLVRAGDHAEAVLGRLNRLVGRQLPGFADTTRAGATGVAGAAPRRSTNAQQGVQRRLATRTGAARRRGDQHAALLEELQQRKQALKQAAETPVERATIEIVALLFQSILTEERIPAAVRVWFARLQMPVLRVAVGEPDFFATIDHPARRLIDRMGACVMGFDASAARDRRGAREGDQARGAGGRGLSRHRPARVPDRADRVREVPRALLQERERGHAQGRVAGAAGRAARDAGDPVHDRAAQDAQRGAGAGRRAPVPVPGLGRRDGDDGGASSARRASDQGDEAGRRRPDLVGQRQGLARGARRGHPPPAAAAEDAARRHGLRRRVRPTSRTSTSRR